MKKLLLISAFIALAACDARAADYPAYTPPDASYSWTGWYFGGVGGYDFGQTADYTIPDLPEFNFNHDLTGFAAGGVVGAQYQAGSFVGGVEGVGLWSNIEGSHDINTMGLQTRTDVDWLVMAKANAGFAYDRFFFYGTGGYAGAQLHPSAKLVMLGDPDITWEDTQWANGFVYGAGLKWAAADNLILGVEWNHVIFKDQDFSDTPGCGICEITMDKVPIKSDVNLDLITAHAEIKF